jgi:hypothetical protein
MIHNPAKLGQSASMIIPESHMVIASQRTLFFCVDVKHLKFQNPVNVFWLNFKQNISVHEGRNVWLKKMRNVFRKNGFLNQAKAAGFEQPPTSMTYEQVENYSKRLSVLR